MRAPVRRRSWSGWSLRELIAFLPLLPMFPAWIPSPNGNYSYSWMIASLRPDLAIRLYRHQSHSSWSEQVKSPSE
jgi:hypothetical protein